MLTTSGSAGVGAMASASAREGRNRTGSVTSTTSFDSLHLDVESVATNNSNHNNSESMISAAKLLFQDCAQGEDDKPVRARRIEYRQAPPPQVTDLPDT